MTPKQLFDYANSFARKAESEGKGTQYPTFSAAARHFRVTLDEIEQACDDWDQEAGYMKPAVGVRAGNQVAWHKHRGDWLVEAYT